jgi:hypothetical protein
MNTGDSATTPRKPGFADRKITVGVGATGSIGRLVEVGAVVSIVFSRVTGG